MKITNPTYHSHSALSIAAAKTKQHQLVSILALATIFGSLCLYSTTQFTDFSAAPVFFTCVYFFYYFAGWRS